MQQLLTLLILLTLSTTTTAQTDTITYPDITKIPSHFEDCTEKGRGLFQTKEQNFITQWEYLELSALYLVRMTDLDSSKQLVYEKDSLFLSDIEIRNYCLEQSIAKSKNSEIFIAVLEANRRAEHLEIVLGKIISTEEYDWVEYFSRKFQGKYFCNYTGSPSCSLSICVRHGSTSTFLLRSVSMIERMTQKAFCPDLN